MVDVLSRTAFEPPVGSVAVISGHGEKAYVPLEALVAAAAPVEHECFLPTAPPSPAERSEKCLPSFPNMVAPRSRSLPGRARPLAPLPVIEPYESPFIASGSTRDSMHRLLQGVDIDDCDAHGENAFFVCDLAEVYRQNERWLRAFGPHAGGRRPVEAFFAVKCNPDPAVIRLLAQLGLGFDCASHAEIAQVLSMGVEPSRIIYANPCKAASFVRYAAQAQVDMMTFDNTDELFKIARNHPLAKLVLRILTDDAGSQCRLGLKFGAPLQDVRFLLSRAKMLGLTVVGVSFHVGSGCNNPDLYDDAIRRAKFVFDVAREVGYDLELLDIGGGFRVDNLEEIAEVVHASVAQHFPAEQSLRVIAEPGRFYVAEAFELATNIIARRGLEEDDDDEPLARPKAVQAVPDETIPVMYYINDGVYGSFNCTMFDHQIVHPEILTLGGEYQPARAPPAGARLEPCSIWGPTCDAIDCVVPTALLPTELLEVGDWLGWANMGAYTCCAASQFNGFRSSLVHYTIDSRGVEKVEAHIRSLLASEKA